MPRLFLLLFGAFLLAGANRDSSVTAQDAPKDVPPQLAALLKLSPEEFIKRFDKGNKGYLVKADLPPALAQNFEKIDANGDGKLDQKEVEQMLQALRRRFAGPQPGQPPAGGGAAPGGKSLADFDALDKKADGRLTRDMVKGTPYEKDFDLIDTNKDGKLDRKEFADYLKKLADKEREKAKENEKDKEKTK